MYCQSRTQLPKVVQHSLINCILICLASVLMASLFVFFFILFFLDLKDRSLNQFKKRFEREISSEKNWRFCFADQEIRVKVVNIEVWHFSDSISDTKIVWHKLSNEMIEKSLSHLWWKNRSDIQIKHSFEYSKFIHTVYWFPNEFFIHEFNFEFKWKHFSLTSKK